MNIVKIVLVPSTVNSITTLDERGTLTNIPIKSEKEFNSVITSLIQTYSGSRNYILVTSDTNIINIEINVIEASLGFISASTVVILGSEMHTSIKPSDSVLSYLINLTKSYNNEFV